MNRVTEVRRGEVRELVDRLAQMAIGQSWTYADLAAQTGCADGLEFRQCVRRAREIVRRDSNICIESLRGEGVKRLGNAEIQKLPAAAARSISKKSKKTIEQIECVDYASLDSTGQVKHNTHMAVFRTLAHMSAPKTLAKTEGQIANQCNGQISIGETIEHFKRNS